MTERIGGTSLRKKQELIARIIEAADSSRLDDSGGYPSEYVIDRGKVYWADYDAGKEYAAITLTVMRIDEFISEHSYWLDES
jgi:hypothetical protein